jgi:DNA-binding response OmpR family regulator
MSIFDRLLGSVRKPTDRPEAPAHPPSTVERRKRKRVNARHGTRVLIIDDSPTVVAALRKVLRSAGYETREALDAEHGLTLIAQDPPDLIFLDIILPGMNGFNALRTIRKTPAWFHIPVVMISGNEHATEQFYADRIGADDFMKKPFSRHEIFARIETMLDGEFVPRRKRDGAYPLPSRAPAEAAQTTAAAQ